MKLQKLREYGWTTQELSRDRQAFFDAFDAYVTRFGTTKDKETNDEDSDDELALHGVIQSIPYSPVKSSGSEAERYLTEPLLKKGDKKTYTEYWKGALTFYPILARMARDYRTILSTNVPSESVFSIAGIQITKRRNRLAPKTMGIIMCLRSWGLISEEEDDDDEESDDEDIHKDKALALRRIEPDEVIMSSQP
jgi:hypothetical protein